MMRDAPINLRAEPAQRALIDQAASALGKNRSDFMLEAACERAKTVLLDQVYFELNEEVFQRFVAALDAPLTDNPRLQRLLARTPVWQR
jgi:uncharacterized protein (DUF1778 family)